jgi:hypothetical protein
MAEQPTPLDAHERIPRPPPRRRLHRGLTRPPGKPQLEPTRGFR